MLPLFFIEKIMKLWIIAALLLSFCSIGSIEAFSPNSPSASMLVGHKEEMQEWDPGDLHPLFVHFPIALLFVALAIDLLYLFGKAQHPSHWFVIIAAAIAIPTVITGLLTSDEHMDNPYVLIHRNWALVTLTYTVLHAFFRIYAMQSRKFISAYLFVVLSLINVALVTITAEYGGSITRGRGLFIHHKNHTEKT